LHRNTHTDTGAHTQIQNQALRKTESEREDEEDDGEKDEGGGGEQTNFSNDANFDFLEISTFYYARSSPGFFFFLFGHHIHFVCKKERKSKEAKNTQRRRSNSSFFCCFVLSFFSAAVLLLVFATLSLCFCLDIAIPRLLSPLFPVGGSLFVGPNRDCNYYIISLCVTRLLER